MKEQGILDHLQAFSLSQVAAAVQSHDFPTIKMTKNVRDGISHHIAATLALQYLSEFHLRHTLSCIQTETNSSSKLTGGMTAAAAQAELGLQGHGVLLRDFVDEWATAEAAVVDGNVTALRTRLQARLSGLGQAPEVADDAAAEPAPGSKRYRKRKHKYKREGGKHEHSHHKSSSHKGDGGHAPTEELDDDSSMHGVE
jgi:hypothetical protein